MEGFADHVVVNDGEYLLHAGDTLYVSEGKKPKFVGKARKVSE